MSKLTKKKRTSKYEWVEAALVVLEREGVDGIKIDRLARNLKTAKSGFYWHFQDRAKLLKEVLSYWRTEYTEVVINNGKQLDLPPEELLYAVMKMIEEHALDRYETHMKAWAGHDPEAAAVMADVYQQRFEFIRSIFSDMGFSGCDLDMRTRLWLCYAMNGKSMLLENSCDEGEDLIKIRHVILTNKAGS
jgi:AcrR family transcriptional regulator